MKYLLKLCAIALFGIMTCTTAHAASSQYPNSGKVLEMIDTDMYTYIQVSNKGADVWLAASKTKVAKGATINYGTGAVMTNFHSKALNRTFPQITFIDKVEVVK